MIFVTFRERGHKEHSGDFISVYKVQEMTQKELDVLSKLGVLYG